MWGILFRVAQYFFYDIETLLTYQANTMIPTPILDHIINICQ